MPILSIGYILGEYYIINDSIFYFLLFSDHYISLTICFLSLQQFFLTSIIQSINTYANESLYFGRENYILSTVLIPNISKPIFKVFCVNNASFNRLSFEALFSTHKIWQFL